MLIICKRSWNGIFMFSRNILYCSSMIHSLHDFNFLPPRIYADFQLICDMSLWLWLYWVEFLSSSIVIHSIFSLIFWFLCMFSCDLLQTIFYSIAFLPNWPKGWTCRCMVPLLLVHLNVRMVHPMELAFLLLWVRIFLDFQANQPKAKKN